MHKFNNIQTVSTYEVAVVSSTISETYQLSKMPHYDTLFIQFVYGVVAVMVIVALGRFLSEFFNGMTKLVDAVIKLIEVLVK